ncbi:class I SAM-dependent methyltransferase [Polynucleobacter paneuropaeus]|nr:class I SAM-dependent methyltransferase [Polynucleobacter paneuropaeus]
MPEEKEISSLYPTNYQNYRSGNPLLRSLYSLLMCFRAYIFGKKYNKEIHILDYGCGGGAFMEELLNQGFSSIYGFEPIDDASPSALDGRIFRSLESLRMSGKKFDLVIMNHVIEHLFDYESLFATLGMVLAINGVVIGQTPNSRHWATRLFKRFWGPLHYPYHTIIFSPKSIEIQAKKYGFILISARGSILPTGYALSIENLLKNLFSSLEGKKGRCFFYGVLSLFFLPFSIFEMILPGVKTSNFDFCLIRKSCIDIAELYHEH